MKLLYLYKWIAGSKSDFTRPFQNDPNLFKRAQAFWDQLDNASLVLVVTCIGLGLLLAISYYGPYNEKPGRHYKPSHWVGFFLATFVISLLLTYVVENIAVTPELRGAVTLELKIALGNAVYSLVIFFLTSVIWCNSLPTNAYRLFKM